MTRAEKKKWDELIALIPEEKQKIAESLIADATFMTEQLKKLRAAIEEKGWSEHYQNGANQFGKKSSVEAEAYIRLQKNHAAMMKQLSDMLPTSEAKAAGADILDFLGKE